MEALDINSLLQQDSEIITLKEKDDDDDEGDGDDGEEDEEERKKKDEEQEKIEGRFQYLQEILDDFIQHPSNELILPIPLEGKIDFAPISKIKILEKIVFAKPGRVTEIVHLPNRLVELVCPQQHLTNLGILPKTLKYLTVNENKIRVLDLDNTLVLQKLNISDNDLELLLHIPPSLKELYCDYNRVESLEFPTGNELEILHIRNNQTLMVIKGILSSHLKEFHFEETRYQEMIGQDQDQSQSDQDQSQKSRKSSSKKDKFPTVREALEKYYSMKARYESSTQNRKNKKKKDDTCIQCKKIGGTIFEIKNKHLIARCGRETNPCFYIEIDRGNYCNLAKYRESLQEEYKQIQQEIINIRYQVSYEYLKDGETLLAKTNRLKTIDERLSQINTAWLNEKQREETQDKVKELDLKADQYLKNIHEDYQIYLENPTQEKLYNIVKMQIEHYTPCKISLHRLQYKKLYDKVEEESELQGLSLGEVMRVYEDSYFIQEYALQKQSPRVIQWNI